MTKNVQNVIHENLNNHVRVEIKSVGIATKLLK